LPLAASAAAFPYFQPAAKKQRLDVNGTAATPAAAAGGSSTIFVGNLPWSATEDDIAGLFADCGEVTGVRIGEWAAWRQPCSLLLACCLLDCSLLGVCITTVLK
jgi:hypothetical protein